MLVYQRVTILFSQTRFNQDSPMPGTRRLPTSPILLPWRVGMFQPCRYQRMIINMAYQTCAGWWLTYPSEKYEFVSWDDDIPNWMEKLKNVPNHQPDMSCICLFSFVQNSMGIKHSSIVSHRPPETSGFAASTPRLDPAVFLTVFLWVSKYPNLMSWSWVTLR